MSTQKQIEDEIIDKLYVPILQRKPTQDERRMLCKTLQFRFECLAYAVRDLGRAIFKAFGMDR